MATMYNELNEDLTSFIEQQHIFFVSTAPNEGRINLSPKGMDTFRCIDEHTVAFLNLTGSGNETEAHLVENGRITIMFCSFTRKPLILRLYGQGKSILPEDAEWTTYAPSFDLLPGTRQIIVMHIENVQTSCGYAVPFYEFQSERDTLKRWAEHKGEDGLSEYWLEKNQLSIDGLPTRLME